MNKVFIIGNLSKDVEISTTSAGIKVAKFSVAVQRRFKNANGENEVDFLNVIAWRNLAENCDKFLSKGRKVAVVGSLQTRTYDAQDGSKRYVTEIVADEVEFLGGKKEDSGDLKPVEDDGLPF